MADADLAAQHHDNEVLAPALFWAFLSIALNTMTQPSGRILGFPRIYNFALRISPIVCAANAISTLVELVCRICILRSVKKAFLAIAAQKFKSEEGPTESDGEFTNLRRNSVFRVGFLVLGALPQAVMLYACKGIPWAQGCCTAYLASFVIDEVLLYVSSNHDNSGLSEYDEPLPVERLFGRAAGVVRGLCGFLFTELFLCLSGFFLYFYLFLPVGLSLVVFMTVAAFTVMSLGGGLWLGGCLGESPRFGDFKYAVYPTSIWTAFGMGGAAIPHGKNSPGLQTWLGVFSALIILGFLASKSERSWSESSSTRSAGPLATYMLLHHVGTILIYLAVWYDSTNTFRPCWTNWLG